MCKMGVEGWDRAEGYKRDVGGGVKSLVLEGEVSVSSVCCGCSLMSLAILSACVAAW